MKVAFRVDASSEIGIGHVMRCLTLADALRKHGATIRFVSRVMPAQMVQMMQERNHEFRLLPKRVNERGTPEFAHSHWLDVTQPVDAGDTMEVLGDHVWDWVVVDHYAIGAAWEAALRMNNLRILAIDDLADRAHDCDVILDQNYYENAENRYDSLVPDNCVKALGPSYALLREEFYETAKVTTERDGLIRKILVGFGGSDPTNETAKVLQALNGPDFYKFQIDVIIGSVNENKNSLFDRYAENSRIHFHENATNVASLMSQADLSIGAGGAMNWERGFLGLPSVVIVVADNQAETSEALHRAGIVLNLGRHHEVSENMIAQAVRNLDSDQAAMHSLSERSKNLMLPDGLAITNLKILSTTLDRS